MDLKSIENIERYANNILDFTDDDDLMMGASNLLESMKYFKSYYFKEHKRNPSVKFYSDNDIEEVYYGKR
jgi:hypothetical protein